MCGWIKLHRGLTEWEWYTDANTMRVFLHCLLKANHKEAKWRGNIIERGHFISSYDTLSKELNLTVAKVRTSIKRLILTNEITIKSSSQHTDFKVNNYESYQSMTSDITSPSQTDNKPITTNKNEKNKNNEKKYPGFVANEKEKALYDYRASISKPLKTARGMNGLTNAIKSCSEAWSVSEEKVISHMMEKEWQSVNAEYANPFVNLKPVQTHSAIPAGYKILNPGALND